MGVWCWFVLKGNQMQITAVLRLLVTSFLSIKKLETCCRRQGTKWGQGCLAACFRGGMFTTALTRGSCLLLRVFVRLPVFVSDGTVCERVLSWVFLKIEMGRRGRTWINKRPPPLLCQAVCWLGVQGRASCSGSKKEHQALCRKFLMLNPGLPFESFSGNYFPVKWEGCNSRWLWGWHNILTLISIIPLVPGSLYPSSCIAVSKRHLKFWLCWLSFVFFFSQDQILIHDFFFRF